MPSGIIDFFTGMFVVITGDHHYTHLGKGYAISGDSASIAAGAAWRLSLKTPTDKYIHFRPSRFSSTANSLSLEMYEGSTVSSGTKLVPRNRNRFKKDNSKVEVYSGVTLGVEGTPLLYKESVGSGGASNRNGGAGGADDEIVLNKDTVYDFVFTNTGSSTATVATYQLAWYEEG